MLLTQSFAGSGLLRAVNSPEARLRTDPQACRIGFVASRSVCVHSDTLALCWMDFPALQGLGFNLSTAADTPMALTFPADAETAAHAPLYFLGAQEDPFCMFFASDVTAVAPFLSLQQKLTENGLSLRDLRSLMPVLAPVELARAGHAVSLSTWHQAHKYCPQCGAETFPTAAGAKRQCTAHATHRQYPRTDPVVIALVVGPSSRVLLGRSKGLPAGTLTCLSGFLEQGESIEEAVVREVKEEAGVDVAGVTIIGSQPWPLGRGGSHELMIGCIAHASSEELNVNYEEMGECRWVEREELREALLRSSSPTSPFISRKGALPGEQQQQAEETKDVFFVPPPFAIANHLMKFWVEGDGRLGVQSNM